MKKKDYEKPTIQVFELQHQCQMLAGSPYGINDELQSETVTEGW